MLAPKEGRTLERTIIEGVAMVLKNECGRRGFRLMDEVLHSTTEKSKMIKVMLVVSATVAFCLAGCVAPGTAEQPDYVRAQTLSSPLPPGNMADIAESDALPDEVGGPM